MKEYFSDSEFLGKCAYKKKMQKARRKIDKREYWQTEDIFWLSQKKERIGFWNVILIRNAITGADGEAILEERYFISSLPLDIEEVERVVCDHWMIESYHWHLDVTFREDGNHKLEKQTSYNLNRKQVLNVLELLEVGSRLLGMKKKWYAIGINLEKHLKNL